MSPENPYRAPGAAVADQDRPVGSPAKAVVLGVLVDILGTTAAALALAFAYGVVLAARGASPEDIERTVASMEPTSAVGLIGSAVGCAFSFLGGYVCARIVRRAELKWAGVVAAITAVFGLAVGLQSYSLALILALTGLGVGSVLLGGYVGARRNAARP